MNCKHFQFTFTLMHARMLWFFPANSLSHLKVNRTEIFGNSDITVCLKLAEIDGASHNITIFPQVDVLNITDISICFIAPYNVVHNVSIISSICDMYAVSAEFEVYYGKHACKIEIVYTPHNRYNCSLLNFKLWLIYTEVCMLPNNMINTMAMD